MIHHLHHIAIRVTAVKASRSIAMRPRLLENFYIMTEQEIAPGINVLYFRQDKANMVQALPLLCEVFGRDPNWRMLTERLPGVDLLDVSPDVLARVLEQ